MTCEGYSNYATFGVAVTLDNDRKMSERVHALTFTAIDNAPTDENVTTILSSGNAIWTVEETERFRLADALRDYVVRLCENTNPGPMAAQMMQTGLNEVDWNELAVEYLNLARTEWER